MARSRNVGSDNANAKLNEQMVVIIRVKREQGIAVSQLADTYGVTVRCIYYAVEGRTWKHVKP